MHNMTYYIIYLYQVNFVILIINKINVLSKPNDTITKKKRT